MPAAIIFIGGICTPPPETSRGSGVPIFPPLSGARAVVLADRVIRVGDADVVVGGGMESMSNAPFLLYGARQGLKFGDQTLGDAMVKDGLWCAFESVHMGKHAELTAEKSAI